jgi:glycosyltransferase involved in cell wall biosynthesis
MKVLLTGLPYFTRRNAAYLAEHSPPSDRFIPVDLTTRSGQARFLTHLPSADVVFCFWGTLIRSRAFDLAFRLHKRVVQFWVGTDVLDAAGVVASGAAYPPYMRDCVHVCEAPWTRDELERIGIRAEVAPLAPMGSIAPDQSEISAPATFSVLGYVGRERENFYRLPEFIRLAEDFPDVQFTIAGTDATPAAPPSNLQLLRWTDEEFRLYRDCAAFIRIPEHDGYSYSVREALAWGRHVIASYPYPHCLVASDYESLKTHVSALKTRFDEGRLDANLEGRDFVLSEYDDRRVTDRVRRILAGT